MLLIEFLTKTRRENQQKNKHFRSDESTIDSAFPHQGREHEHRLFQVRSQAINIS